MSGRLVLPVNIYRETEMHCPIIGFAGFMHMDEKNKSYLPDVSAFVDGIATKGELDSIRQDFESEGMTVEMAYRELSEFVYSKQHKELVENGEVFLLFFCDLYKRSKDAHSQLMELLSEKISLGFTQDIIQLVSAALEAQKIIREEAVASIEKPSSTSALFVATVKAYKRFVGAFEWHIYSVSHELDEHPLGKEFMDVWRPFRMAYQKGLILSEMRVERIGKLAACLAKYGNDFGVKTPLVVPDAEPPLIKIPRPRKKRIKPEPEQD